MSRRTEVQVGITVLAALGVLLWGVTWLRELSLARKVRVWHVAFPQTGGLGAADEVLVNGIRKGVVSKIALALDHVVVDLSLDTDVTLTHESRVAIRNVGLMGKKVIAVDLRGGQAYAERDTLLGVYEIGMPEMFAAMGSSMDAMDRIMTSLNTLAARLDKNGDLDQSIANLRVTTQQLRDAMKENRAAIHATVDNAEAATRTVRDLTTGREAQLKRTMDSIDQSTQNLARLTTKIDSLTTVANRIAAKIDHGDGSAAQLINDKKLYEDARATLQGLRDLLADLKANPKKYINLRVF